MTWIYAYLRGLRMLPGIYLLLCLFSCAVHRPTDGFGSDIDRLINRLLATQQHSVQALAPAAVISVSALEGKPMTRLEEEVIASLTGRMRQTREVHELTRQNWLQLLENRPLTFEGLSANERRFFKTMVVYRVKTDYDATTRQLRIRIDAHDVEGRPLSGQLAEMETVVEEGSVPDHLYAAPALRNPLPGGLAETPYATLAEFADQLAGELLAVYGQSRAWVSQSSTDKIRLMVTVQGGQEGGRALLTAMQNAISRHGEFDCVAGHEEAAMVFRQVENYEQHRDLLPPDSNLVAPQSILLNLEVIPSSVQGDLRITLHALWRIRTPDDDAFRRIPTDFSGISLTDFETAAFLSGQALANAAADDAVTRGSESPPVTAVRTGTSASWSTGGGKAKSSWLEPATGMEFAWVPGGCYERQRSDGNDFLESDWQPKEKVCLEGYWIGKTEVTQGQWLTVMGENPARFKVAPGYPVERASWKDIQRFVGRLQTVTGKKFRLPTEAEWEYAAGIGIGGCSNHDCMNYEGQSRSDRWEHTSPVKSFPANDFGIYDMQGNVREWCLDWYGEGRTFFHPGIKNNPRGPAEGQYRVVRGGAWDSTADDCALTARSRLAPEHRQENLGFRLVLPIR